VGVGEYCMRSASRLGRNYVIKGCFYSARLEIGELGPEHVTSYSLARKFRTAKIFKQTTLNARTTILTSSTHPFHLLQAQRGGSTPVRCLTLAAVSAAVSAPENRLHLVRRRRGPQRAEYGNCTRPTEFKYRDTKADIEVGTRDLKTVSNPIAG
jgi:hypothetical protein